MQSTIRCCRIQQHAARSFQMARVCMISSDLLLYMGPGKPGPRVSKIRKTGLRGSCNDFMAAARTSAGTAIFRSRNFTANKKSTQKELAVPFESSGRGPRGYACQNIMQCFVT